LVRAAYVGTAGEDAYWDNHRKFHTALISPAASAWDFRLLVPLWDAAERYTRLVYDTIAASAETTAERKHAHDALITAAGSRDPEEIGSPWFRVSGDVVLAGHAASRAVA